VNRWTLSREFPLQVDSGVAEDARTRGFAATALAGCDMDEGWPGWSYGAVLRLSRIG